MDVLKLNLIIIVLLNLSSCAKLSYIVEQGIGQYDLLTSSRPNDIYLDDPNTPEEVRLKIKQVEKARDYFSKFWNTDKKRAYSRTTILDRKAVSYLVISSPRSRIRPQEHCFWFVGCFPYIGFFSEESAHNFAMQRQEEGLETYVRPVYAYSSLGHFEDPILSSFFVFDEVALTELVFHELYHLLFFVKDEVELNENLAQFFAQKMVEEYFNLPEGERTRKKEASRKLRAALVNLISKLQIKYEKMREQGEEDFEKHREQFMENTFRPFFQEFCARHEIQGKSCFPMYGEWNNARLAAFMTYQKKSQELSELYQRQGEDLRAFQLYIQKKYEQYESESQKQPFSEFLFSVDH